MLTPQQRKQLQNLVARNQNKIKWYDDCFPEQRRFLEDKARLKAALCTRRAGKSMGVGVDICKDAMENPGVSIGVIGLTRDSIKRIYFKDIMSVLDRKYKLGIVTNKTELSMTFPNGSVIYFAGADASEEEMNKFLGQKFFKVVIDEASMYTTIDLAKLVYDVLRPAVADYDGQIVLIGTPSDYLNSLYHKVTDGRELGWSTHKWTWADNPHVNRQIAKQIAEDKLRNPEIESTAGFRQHYMGEWVVDLGSRVYKYNEKINSWPMADLKGYQYVLGIDLGYEDDTAFVVGAWSHYDQVLHVVHAESAPHLILSDVEQRIKRLQSTFKIATIVVDGASKQGVEELQTRFGLHFYRADKQGKKDFIELMNNDFYQRRLNLVPNCNTALIKEYESLIWDDKAREKGEWKESKTCPNHLADAALYMWRWCYNYAAIPKDKPETEEQRMERQMIEQDTSGEEKSIYDNSDMFG